MREKLFKVKLKTTVRLRQDNDKGRKSEVNREKIIKTPLENECQLKLKQPEHCGILTWKKEKTEFSRQKTNFSKKNSRIDFRISTIF